MQTSFIGGAYKGRSTDINAQVCINYYPEVDQMEAKNIRALFGTPGLVQFATTSTVQEVRGFHVVGAYLYAVAGMNLYRIDSGGSVDTITGTLNSTTGKVWMADNGTELVITDGVKGYIYDTSLAGDLTQIADADFPIPSSVAFQDGYFIVTEKDTGKMYISASYDGNTWDPLDYATAEAHPDDAQMVIMDHRELWVFGEQSIEVYYNSGDADFPFDRVPGVYIQEGTDAPGSVCRCQNTLFYLNHKGQVCRINGYNPQVVSTPHIEYMISTYGTTSDALAYSYSQEGHEFYVLTFPLAQITWVYDAVTSYWHQRRSYPTDLHGDDGRHRGNCYALFDRKHLVGDYENGKIYEMSMSTYTDDSEAIRRIRAAQIIHNDRKLIFFNAFEIDFESGVGLYTGQGNDPQAMLDWSDDGGHTWSNEHWVDIGAIGEYRARAVWRRLGRSRNRVFRVSISDPVKTVIIAAHLDAQLGVA